jgi:hypothetical protein
MRLLIIMFWRSVNFFRPLPCNILLRTLNSYSSLTVRVKIPHGNKAPVEDIEIDAF